MDRPVVGIAKVATQGDETSTISQSSEASVCQRGPASPTSSRWKPFASVDGSLVVGYLASTWGYR